MKKLKFNIEVDLLNFYKIQFNILLNSTKNGVIFKDSHLSLLAYLKIYGTEGKFKALEDKLFLSLGTIHNLIHNWRKQGLITGKKGELTINPNLPVSSTPINFDICLQVKE